MGEPPAMATGEDAVRQLISYAMADATGSTAYLANGGVFEHAQGMAAHESPRSVRPPLAAPVPAISASM
jgi:hypothetical protein